ncbi:FecR family protein [Dysgonomonas sp. 520]|uniref:FecR family protein n=1 Tax=Dysgonomonas sp. 520 TaxID=2302931 RepID=UPI0013D82244|nr:FecR domain-containing protein [Dysgonomonas sp. 520]NDW08442.1 DUF4974 domain-containing protein [Dysgonomonas sp. 520]
MKKKDVSKIIKKYLSGRFLPETEERVQKWIIKEDNIEEKERASLEYWDELEESENSETYTALNRVNERIGYSRQAPTIPLYKKIRRIAAVLLPLFILAGGYLYYQSIRSNLIEIKVAYGENKHLFLPDSSEIWLNAGTTIKYPKKFKGDERSIYLDGEAYFSVKRNEQKPFVVQTEKISVKVLGTKFNVKAYVNDEKIITTLTSGKVEVSTNNESHILKPNEQLSYDRSTSSIDIVEVSSDETDSWLSGQLVFNDSSLKDILLALERRFDISITNNTAIPASKLYTVKFLRNETPEEVLNILQEVVGFTYLRQGRNIILTSKQ